MILLGFFSHMRSIWLSNRTQYVSFHDLLMKAKVSLKPCLELLYMGLSLLVVWPTKPLSHAPRSSPSKDTLPHTHTHASTDTHKKKLFKRSS